MKKKTLSLSLLLSLFTIGPVIAEQMGGGLGNPAMPPFIDFIDTHNNLRLRHPETWLARRTEGNTTLSNAKAFKSFDWSQVQISRESLLFANNLRTSHNLLEGRYPNMEWNIEQLNREIQAYSFEKAGEKHLFFLQGEHDLIHLKIQFGSLVDEKKLVEKVLQSIQNL